MECPSGKESTAEWMKAGPWVAQCHHKDAEIHRCHWHYGIVYFPIPNAMYIHNLLGVSIEENAYPL